MNGIFFVVFVLSGITLCIISPDIFLSSMLSASEKALKLCFTLLIIYGVWLGLLQLLKDSGCMQKVSRLMKPINKKLFNNSDSETLNYISGNISANILGIGGVATPLGIKAVELLDKSPNSEYAQAMFFIINATSLQLLPTTVIALRQEYNSLSSYDIILPTLICTLFSTIMGVTLIYLLYRKKRKALCG